MLYVAKSLRWGHRWGRRGAGLSLLANLLRAQRSMLLVGSLIPWDPKTCCEESEAALLAVLTCRCGGRTLFKGSKVI
jgi:hypothetical protein